MPGTGLERVSTLTVSNLELKAKATSTIVGELPCCRSSVIAFGNLPVPSRCSAQPIHPSISRQGTHKGTYNIHLNSRTTSADLADLTPTAFNVSQHSGARELGVKAKSRFGQSCRKLIGRYRYRYKELQQLGGSCPAIIEVTPPDRRNGFIGCGCGEVKWKPCH